MASPGEFTPTTRPERPSRRESIPTDRLLVEVDVYLLHMQVFLHTPPPQLSTDSTLLISTPRRLDERRRHLVPPHDSGAYPLHCPHRPEDVARPDGRREPVRR